MDAAALTKDLLHDAKGESHYSVVSAFIKSMRGSDPDSALYWMARMIEGGEDPMFIARRMVIFASEDIGNADLRALPLAVSAMQTIQLIGMPEARITLGQACSYLASAHQSPMQHILRSMPLFLLFEKMGHVLYPPTLQIRRKATNTRTITHMDLLIRTIGLRGCQRKTFTSRQPLVMSK